MSSSRTSSVIARTRKAKFVAAVFVLALLSASIGIWQYGMSHNDAIAETPETMTASSSDGQQESVAISARAASRSHEGAPAPEISKRDVERLRAYRATTAADAVAHIRQLPIDDSGRLFLLLAISSICRPLQEFDRTAYISGAAKRGYPDTAKQRRLLEAWWAEAARYCAGVVIAQLRSEADLGMDARTARGEQIHSGQKRLDAADWATLDPEELLLLLAVSDIAIDLDTAGEADRQGVIGALWSTFLTSSNPEPALQAGTALSNLRDGAFADTGKLIPEDPSDPRLWDGNTYHGNSRPSSRQIKVWEATVELFVCRSTAACGPGTARGLFRRPVSELHLATGSEGYWRSMLTPLEWEAVETMLRRLEAERQAARPR